LIAEIWATDKDRQDYTVYTGGCDVGRIYKMRGGPDHLRWFWSFARHGPMTRSDRVATLEEAKAQFQKTWDAWKAWAKLEEAPWPGLNSLLVIVKSMSFGDPPQLLSTVSTQDGHGPAGVPTAAPRFRTIQVCPKDVGGLLRAHSVR
jgi:hypothetical protein